MASTEYESEIVTGRRDNDGRVRLSLFTTDMLAVTLEGHGERAPTLLLTTAQAVHLRDALSEVITLLEEAGRKEIGDGNDDADAAVPSAVVWQGTERRTTGQLNK